MTFFDAGILLLVAIAVLTIIRVRSVIGHLEARQPVYLLTFGLCVIGSLYAADFYTMWVMPRFWPPESASAAMLSLHLNWSWVVLFIGVAGLVLGLTSLLATLLPRMSQTVRGLSAEVQERELVESALRESEARLTSVIENAPVEIFLKDLEGHHVIVSPKWRYFFKVEVGQTTRDVFSDEEADFHLAHDREVIETAQAVEKEFTIAGDAEGRTFLSTKFPILESSGKLIGVGGIVSDISDRKRNAAALQRAHDELESRIKERTADLEKANDSLRNEVAERLRAQQVALESQRLLKAITDHSSSEILVKDLEGRFLMVNRKFEEISGVTAAYALNKKNGDIFPDEEAQSFEAHDREVLRTGMGSIVEIPITVRGERRILLTSKFPIFGADGQIEATGSICTDITERKLAEEAVRTLNEDLERLVEERTAELRAAQEDLVRKERLAMLGQLTGTVSHELRNPLGAIRVSAAAIAKLAGDEEGPLLRSAEVLERSVKRCDNIIADLLEYSRVRPLDLRSLELDGLLRQTLDDMDLPEDIRVIRKIRSGAMIACDGERLSRAVLNLVSNACQSLQGDPSPEQASHPEITVGSRVDGDRAEIWVRDNGPGIREDERDKIFEPLFSTKAFGVGLGLAIVKHTVEQHCGELVLENSAGSGACFRIFLPLASEIEAEKV